jgi:hypothetical protein
MDFLLGFVLGAFVLALYYLFSKKSFFKEKSKEQSVVLLDKIKNVSKLITVEGNFNEIMHFSDVKSSLLNIVSSKKKAIIIANAKVYIGFNMKKAEFQVNPNKQTIKMLNFPNPEVLSIETDIEYYDVKNGLFNKFDASELTDLNKKIKQNIADKIPESDLLISAQNKAIETLNIIEQMVDTFGWKLDYSKNNETPKLDKKDILKKLLP